MSIEFDASEVREFAARLSQAGAATEQQVGGIIERGANNVKRQLRREMSASRHFKGVARAITYDMRTAGAFGGGIVEAEIGPEAGSPGSLANIAYFGSSRGGGTVPDPEGALEAEAPNVMEWLAKAAEGSL
jgi:hypothetical protein